MCENMIVSEVCVVSEVLCSVSDGHYTGHDNFLVSDEEKGRRAHTTCVSYLRRREMHPHNVRLISQEHVSPSYLACTKRMFTEYFS
jgi:hypothetical protein